MISCLVLDNRLCYGFSLFRTDSSGGSMPSTRRTFLTMSAAAGASLAAFKSLLLWAKPGGPARTWITSKNHRFEPIDTSGWRHSTVNPQKAIRVESTERYQKILGFGAAFTDASCALLHQLDAQQRLALLSELFGPAGLRLSLGRTCIGSSDYSTSAYSFDDGPEPDPELKRFSIEHDRSYILPTLRAAREVNADLFLFSSPWSPPGWMKAGASLLGGSMRKLYFPSYADYFVKFLQGYATEGVKINAVTVQNEVDTDQNGRMPAALWGQEYEIEFVKNHLGPAFERSALDTKIWILDHNYSLWGRVMDELSDPGVFKYVDGVAWHGYDGTPDAMKRVHDAFPTKGCYWTEGGPDYKNPNYQTEWVRWSRTFTGVLRNSAQCITGWNLVLDEKGMPNIGPFSCGGLITVNAKTQEVTRSGQYWAFAHYSKMLQRGAQVLGSHGDLPGIDHVAFENPDGSRVLVVTNAGDEQDIQCRLPSQSVNLRLEPGSITTLVI
jgi:glucosylceramidase